MQVKEQKSFGSFGSGKPTIRKKNPWSAVVFYGVLLLLALFFGPSLYHKAGQVYRTMVEREPPVATFAQVPIGFGQAPSEVQIEVSDRHSGLDQVVVQLEQSRKVVQVLKREYSRVQHKDTLTLQIDAKALGIRPGDVSITVRLFDKSLWSNSAKESVLVRVDYTAPKIELLSNQHNIVEGGVELVFYRLPEEPKVFSGVVVGPNIFPGFPAITLDEGFATTPDVYFAFFAVPGDAADQRPQVRLIARDEVGNTENVSVPFRVSPRKQGVTKVSMKREQALRVVDQTYQSYLRFRERLAGHTAEFYPTVSDEELLERFQLLLDEFNPAVEREAKRLFSQPVQERFWKGSFGRPRGKPHTARFFWEIEWSVGELLLGRSKAKELWFQSASGREISAVNHGKVIYAGSLGTYGSTVILDHGFGLTTLYTHLSSLGCAEGDELRKGELIGLTGSSGLIPFSGSGFQLRLHGVPIRPEEWWDSSWLSEHVERKVLETQKLLGISYPRPIKELGDWF